MKASQLTKENITPEIVDKLLFEGLDYKGCLLYTSDAADD